VSLSLDTYLRLSLARGLSVLWKGGLLEEKRREREKKEEASRAGLGELLINGRCGRGGAGFVLVG
jgi:hypothetical protein